MYLSSKLWFLAAVQETETSEKIFFPWLDLFFSMALEKKVQPRKKKVLLWFRSFTGQKIV